MEPTTTADLQDTAGEIQDAAVDMAAVLLGGTVGVVVGLLVGVLLLAAVRFLLRRHAPARHLVRRARKATTVVTALLGARLGIQAALSGTAAPGWVDLLNHVLEIGVIVAISWLLVAVIMGVEDAALETYGGEGIVQGSRARRVQTQVQMLNRVAVAVVVTIGVAAVLLTFPSARTIGTSILASAGIASVVVGLAAQSVLGNLFAGLQIAFTDSLRIDDTVLVEGELGNVEEMTLTYVVVRVWDERRLILPSSHFTTTPFLNYTKTDPAMTGTVEFDVDWTVPLAPMRVELQRLLATCRDWDGRTGDLEVTDAVNGSVRLRLTVSAADNGKLWGVRVHVREGIVEWLQNHAPYAVSKTHLMEHPEPAGWVRVDGIPDDADADMRELVAAVQQENRETTIDRDVRALSAGTGARPGETARISARAARRAATKRDRRRSREQRGGLGRADEATWMAVPSTETTRILPGLPPAEELPEPPADSLEVDAAPYGALPHDLDDAAPPRWDTRPAGGSSAVAPERRSVRTRLAAMGRTARHHGGDAEDTRLAPEQDRQRPDEQDPTHPRIGRHHDD